MGCGWGAAAHWDLETTMTTFNNNFILRASLEQFNGKTSGWWFGVGGSFSPKRRYECDDVRSRFLHRYVEPCTGRIRQAAHKSPVAEDAPKAAKDVRHAVFPHLGIVKYVRLYLNLVVALPKRRRLFSFSTRICSFGLPSREILLSSTMTLKDRSDCSTSNLV